MNKCLYVIKDTGNGKYLGFDEFCDDGYGEYISDVSDFTDVYELGVYHVKFLSENDVNEIKKVGFEKHLVYKLNCTDVKNLVIEKYLLEKVD